MGQTPCKIDVTHLKKNNHEREYRIDIEVKDAISIFKINSSQKSNKQNNIITKRDKHKG